jgi:hypothetical protein
VIIMTPSNPSALLEYLGVDTNHLNRKCGAGGEACDIGEGPLPAMSELITVPLTLAVPPRQRPEPAGVCF